MWLFQFIAIGPVTENAITERGLSVFGTAKKPNPDELLNVILNKWFKYTYIVFKLVCI